MTSRHLRSTLFAVSLVLGSVLPTIPSVARAQTHDEIEEARKLFNDAYKDEQDKRFADALEKFRRVAKVKESGSVRYRIGSCLEGLGKLREARDEFRALAAQKPSLPPNQQDVADSAAERARELDKRIPKIVVQVEDRVPPDLRLTVDGAPLAATRGAASVELDPGDHVIQASGEGMKPYETKVTLAAGAGEVRLAFRLEPVHKEQTAPASSGRNDTLAYVALGTGGALLLTGTALLIARENAISDVESACPSGVCPTRLRNDVQSDIDRAELFGPLGGILGAAGLLAGGLGVYLLLRPHPAGSAPATPTGKNAASSEGWRFGSRSIRGGVILGMGTSF